MAWCTQGKLWFNKANADIIITHTNITTTTTRKYHLHIKGPPTQSHRTHFKSTGARVHITSPVERIRMFSFCHHTFATRSCATKQHSSHLNSIDLYPSNYIIIQWNYALEKTATRTYERTNERSRKRNRIFSVAQYQLRISNCNIWLIFAWTSSIAPNALNLYFIFSILCLVSGFILDVISRITGASISLVNTVQRTTDGQKYFRYFGCVMHRHARKVIQTQTLRAACAAIFDYLKHDLILLSIKNWEREKLKERDKERKRERMRRSVNCITKWLQFFDYLWIVWFTVEIGVFVEHKHLVFTKCICSLS